MSIFTLRDDLTFLRSDDYLRDGGATPAPDIQLYPPLWVSMGDSQYTAVVPPTATRANLLDSQTRVIAEN